MKQNKMELTLYQKFIFPFLKRIIDILVSVILLIFLLPLFILISLIIFLETGRSPIFVQKRSLSLNSRHFNIYKFRTFKEDDNSSVIGTDILFKPHLEEKLSSFGRFLRKTGLDELPQLINILQGDMSLVGPRPLSIDDLQEISRRYPEKHFKRCLLKSKPGLTGLWQTTKDDDFSVDYLIFTDELYEREKSFLLDFYILVNTLRVLVFAKHKDGVIKGEFSPDKLRNFAFYTGLSLILMIIFIIEFVL